MTYDTNSSQIGFQVSEHSGLWHRLVLLVNTNVSEEHPASLFKVDAKSGGSRFLRNVSVHVQDYAVSQFRRQSESSSLLACNLFL
jgi:hypothetical protein